MKKAIAFIILLFMVVSVTAGEKEKIDIKSFAASVDNQTYIDANYLLMLISNAGLLGYDRDDVFGFDAGTFYPYISVDQILDQTLNKNVLYSAGPWLGGKVNDSVRVSFAEYSTEFVPGPMVDSTFIPDDPSFKVYKLYADSMGTNPNDDYLNWPVSQGAPIDEMGHPRLYGDQTLWAVFNDADTSQQLESMAKTPLGIEVQLTVWAEIDEGDDTLFIRNTIALDTSKATKQFFKVNIVDAAQLTGHAYMVVTDNDDSLGAIWSLIDNTTSDTILARQTFKYNDTLAPITDGFQIELLENYFDIDQIQVIANAAGPLDPPESGAAGWAGFPTPTDVDPGGNPTDNQQVGAGKWLLSAVTSFDVPDYDLWYKLQFFESYERLAMLGQYDWEMRFTGSYDNPGVGGSYVYNYDEISFWVPFELWRTGVGTPDDLRCLPMVYNDDDNQKLDLACYGTWAEYNCQISGCESALSDGNDDPSTDRIYWIVPIPENSDPTSIFGDSAYLAFEDLMINDPTSYEYGTDFTLMSRLSLVNWDGGTAPPFNQELPEQGTIFRITTKKEIPVDTISFVTTKPLLLTSGAEGTSIYLMYKLYNKGVNQIDSCYFSVWSDPNIGDRYDDNVACDTLDNVFYSYNYDNFDKQYGSIPPVVGFKYIHGPLVPSPGQTANYENNIISDYKNLGMTSFFPFVGGLDPDDATEAYNYMRGLEGDLYGSPYVYNGDTLTYKYSGDPVTGTGDYRYIGSDYRMFASSGPFDFYPGDSQYVLIKMAVGQGSDNLSSITKLREILNRPFSYYPTDVDDITPPILPDRFELAQNYPNPFNPTTTISYRLPTKAKVKLEIFNILGQKVTTLIDAEQTAGTHKVEWNGTNQSGDQVTTGVYLYRLTTDKFEQTKKMMLLK